MSSIIPFDTSDSITVRSLSTITTVKHSNLPAWKRMTEQEAQHQLLNTIRTLPGVAVRLASEHLALLPGNPSVHVIRDMLSAGLRSYFETQEVERNPNLYTIMETLGDFELAQAFLDSVRALRENMPRWAVLLSSCGSRNRRMDRVEQMLGRITEEDDEVDGVTADDVTVDDVPVEQVNTGDGDVVSNITNPSDNDPTVANTNNTNDQANNDSMTYSGSANDASGAETATSSQRGSNYVSSTSSGNGGNTNTDAANANDSETTSSSLIGNDISTGGNDATNNSGQHQSGDD